jgi:hypothetical protein
MQTLCISKYLFEKLVDIECIPYRSQLKTSICKIQGVSSDIAHCTSTAVLNTILLSCFMFPYYKESNYVICFRHSIHSILVRN